MKKGDKKSFPTNYKFFKKVAEELRDKSDGHA